MCQNSILSSFFESTQHIYGEREECGAGSRSILLTSGSGSGKPKNMRILCTVTSPDINFCYPDQVPLTQFVHTAKKIMACGPEFSVEFSAPPEFSGSVTEKYLSTGWAGTFDLQIMKQIFYHCATASLCTYCYGIHCVPSWDFLAVSVVTRSRIFRPYLVVTCRDFPAVSAVTGSRIFRPSL
jgi:hypothetical protein